MRQDGGTRKKAPETGAETSDFTDTILASLGKARFRAAEFEVSGKCQWLQRSLKELPQASALLEDAY